MVAASSHRSAAATAPSRSRRRRLFSILARGRSSTKSPACRSTTCMIGHHCRLHHATDSPIAPAPQLGGRRAGAHGYRYKKVRSVAPTAFAFGAAHKNLLHNPPLEATCAFGPGSWHHPHQRTGLITRQISKARGQSEYRASSPSGSLVAGSLLQSPSLQEPTRLKACQSTSLSLGTSQ